MATLEEAYVAMEIQQDLMRVLPNIHDNITAWRAQVAGGDTSIGPNLTAAARAYRRRLKRISDFATAQTAAFDAALALLSVTRNHADNRINQYMGAMLTFRQASKTTGPEITAAITALEAAVPSQKRFLFLPLPSEP